MTPYVAIARTTARQVVGGKRLIGFALLILAPAAIMWLSTANQSPAAAVDDIIDITVGTFFVVAIPVVSVMLATTALGAERRDATISFIALRPLRRSSIGLAKIVGSVLTAFTLTGFGALAIGLVALVRLEDAGYLIPLLIASLISTLAYTAILVPLGYITERASVIGLAYIFIWESAIAGTVPGLAWSSLWRIGFVAFAALAPPAGVEAIPPFSIGDLDPGVGSSLTRVVILTAIGAAITGWLLRTRDLV